MSEARGRSYSRSRGFVARLRSRSASINRAKRFNGETDPIDTSNHLISNKIEDIVERHQLALKMDMVELMETQEKEAKFWKRKADKLKKRLSLVEKESGDKDVDEPEQPLQDEPMKDAERQQYMDRVAMLQQQLQDRDAQIESLRQTMEAQEQANGDRVRLLENQLERLMEIQQKVRGGSCQTSASTAPTELIDISNAGADSNLSDLDQTNNTGKEGKSDDPRHEISALEQLLARVLAEKDKLSFENANLKSVVSETVPGSSDIPDASDAEQGGCSPKADTHSTMYQLSCRNCEGQQFVSDTTKNLKKAAKEHFSTVWQVVQVSKGKDDTNSDNIDPSLGNSEFRHSSLAHHLANHCKDMDTEHAVRKWCKKNVKLERIMGEPQPDSDQSHGLEF